MFVVDQYSRNKFLDNECRPKTSPRRKKANYGIITVYLNKLCSKVRSVITIAVYLNKLCSKVHSVITVAVYLNKLCSKVRSVIRGG